MKLRIRNHLLFFYHYKIRRSYGVTDKIKGTEKHWLLIDVDSKVKSEIVDAIIWAKNKYGDGNVVEYVTPSGGCHIIVFKCFTWVGLLHELIGCPYVDLSWVSFGMKKGYFFLETYEPITHKGLTYMMHERLT